MEKTFKQFATQRMAALETERSSWITHYRELSDYVLPRKGRFLNNKPNQGDKINQKIIDGTAGEAVRTLASGIMSGLTSPARPWFKLALPNVELMESGPVKQWLEIVEQRLNMVFSRSNLYNSLPLVYEELAVFGTAPMMIESDFDDVIRTTTFTAGEYMIATNDKGEVNTFGREFKATVLQLVNWFGKEKCSAAVRTLYDNGAYDQWIDVCHLIEENDGRYDLGGFQKNRDYRGMYWEKGASGEEFLEVKGYYEFPLVCPRWHITSSDIYGRSPAMDGLGDIKQLQAEQKRKLEALDKWVRPPMKAPTSMKHEPASILPASITYVDETKGGQGYMPAMQVNGDIRAISEDIMQVKQRIRSVFYADLFLMTTMSDRRQITAREIEERHEEKLLMLGPVLERLNDEFLDPLIDRTFAIMVRMSQPKWERGEPAILPKPPKEIQNMPLDVEYISILAQAQKSVATSGIDRLIGVVGNAAQLWPEARYKIDIMDTIDKYANMLGTPASTVVPSDQAREQIAQEQQQAQQAQAMAMAQQAAETGRTLSETKTADGQRSALDAMMEGMR